MCDPDNHDGECSTSNELRRLISWSSSTAVIIEQAAVLLNGVTRGDVEPDDPRLTAFGVLALTSIDCRPPALREAVRAARELHHALAEELLRLSADHPNGRQSRTRRPTRKLPAP